MALKQGVERLFRGLAHTVEKPARRSLVYDLATRERLPRSLQYCLRSWKEAAASPSRHFNLARVDRQDDPSMLSMPRWTRKL